jgi:xylulose-5-phosphate/fructose-6-phosphate phosphoketolase
MAERRSARNTHRNIHVGGFVEEVTTTTPFDMTMLGELG